MSKLILYFLFATVLGFQGAHSSRTAMAPYPLTAAEKARARALADQLLRDKWLPLVTRSPQFCQLDGVEIKNPRLADPFFDVTLRWRSLSDYQSSSEIDPRAFASVLIFAFPIYVEHRDTPIMALCVCRNRNEDGNKFEPDEGEFIFWGYFCAEGRTQLAEELRTQLGGEISFVSFLDTSLERILVETADGLQSGASADELQPMSKDALGIKSALPAPGD